MARDAAVSAAAHITRATTRRGGKEEGRRSYEPSCVCSVRPVRSGRPDGFQHLDETTFLPRFEGVRETCRASCSEAGAGMSIEVRKTAQGLEYTAKLPKTLGRDADWLVRNMAGSASGFGAIAADALLIRPYIPEPLRPQYDRLVELALRQAVLPEAEALRDERPLAEVVPIGGKG